jgi:hypothetical protein
MHAKARRIAVNIAKLPELLRKGLKKLSRERLRAFYGRAPAHRLGGPSPQNEFLAAARARIAVAGDNDAFRSKPLALQFTHNSTSHHLTHGKDERPQDASARQTKSGKWEIRTRVARNRQLAGSR